METFVIVAVTVFKIVWLLSILLGTGYVVFWLGYSGWWWLFAVFLLVCSGTQASVEVTKGEQ